MNDIRISTNIKKYLHINMTIHIFTKKVMEEIWKSIKNYEGYYEVSNFGNVRSVDRVVNGRKYFGRELKKLDAYGYKAIQLRKNITKGCFYIHRLVAIAFIDNDLGYDIVNHKDENKTNNHFKNLEWCSKSHNAIHSSGGNSSATRLFTKKEIIEIRNRYKLGETVYKISKELNHNTGTISNIINRKTYKDVV